MAAASSFHINRMIFCSTMVPMLCLVGLLTIVNFPSMIQADIFSDISDSLKKGFDNTLQGIQQTACIITHRSEFEQCYEQIKNVYTGLNSPQDQSYTREFCCSYIAYRDCVETVAYSRCGSEAAQTADSLMNTFKDSTQQCKDYSNILDCMDPMIRAAVIVGVIVIAIALLGCLIKICLSCCS